VTCSLTSFLHPPSYSLGFNWAGNNGQTGYQLQTSVFQAINHHYLINLEGFFMLAVRIDMTVAFTLNVNVCHVSNDHQSY
jgi:hypothetical protein